MRKTLSKIERAERNIKKLKRALKVGSNCSKSFLLNKLEYYERVLREEQASQRAIFGV